MKLHLMTSLPAIPLGDRFCFSRRVGQGEMSGNTQMVQTAWVSLGTVLQTQ